MVVFMTCVYKRYDSTITLGMLDQEEEVDSCCTTIPTKHLTMNVLLVLIG